MGAAVAICGGLVFVANAVISPWRGRTAGPDPWGGPGLEWAAASPPPSYNFERTPVVDGPTPLWPEGAPLRQLDGLSLDRREVLVTSTVDAKPDNRQKSPEASFWPLITALAVTVLFVGSIFTPWALVWGAVPVAVAAVGWFWPQQPRATTGLFKAGRP